MQTFLPYPNFKESAKVLDYRRLGKQRVEAFQILRTLTGVSSGWKNHPAVKMWEGHTRSLADYTLTICDEWIKRGYKDSITLKVGQLFCYDDLNPPFSNPKWLGNEEFHASHRSNLLRKNKEYYSKFGWTETDDMNYIWP